MIVVADTSPINYLVLIGQIEILHHFYGHILIPPSVWEELQDQSTPNSVRNWVFKSPAWLEVRSLSGAEDPALGFLDRGEREAITLAQEFDAGRLIADDMLARMEATRRNISVIGTLGVLRNAARANLLDLPEALSALHCAGFHVAPSLIRSLLDEDALGHGRPECETQYRERNPSFDVSPFPAALPSIGVWRVEKLPANRGRGCLYWVGTQFRGISRCLRKRLPEEPR
jgi:predicted nucleic acid-binding protein